MQFYDDDLNNNRKRNLSIEEYKSQKLYSHFKNESKVFEYFGNDSRKFKNKEIRKNLKIYCKSIDLKNKVLTNQAVKKREKEESIFKSSPIVKRNSKESSKSKRSAKSIISEISDENEESLSIYKNESKGPKDSIAMALKKISDLNKKSQNNELIDQWDKWKQNDNIEDIKEIVSLRESIINSENNINHFIEEEKILFKKKYEAYKFSNQKHSFQYDLTYSALFGNGISV